MSYLMIIIGLLFFFDIGFGQAWTYYRRDLYLNTTLYPEDYCCPYVGGRMDIIFHVNSLNNNYPTYTLPFTVNFKGSEIDSLSVIIDPSTTMPDDIDWITCDYNQKTGQIAIQAHVPNDNIVEDIALLTVTDADGTTVGTFTNIAFVHSGLQLEYVHVIQNPNNSDQQLLLLNWYNYYTSGVFQTVANLYFNNKLIDQNIEVYEVENVLSIYNLTGDDKISSGDVWTLHCQLADGLKYGWGGRFINPNQINYPIIAIPYQNQCPFENTNSENNKMLTSELFANSFYLDSNNSCQTSPNDVITYYTNNFGESNDYNTLLISNDLVTSNDTLNIDGIEDSTLGIAINNLDSSDNVQLTNLKTHINDVYATALQPRLWYPNLLTTLYCETNEEVGSFAGLGDIQIIRFYMAGCGETSISSNTNNIPVTSVFDYCDNARQNMMPKPTYGVIQLFNDYTNDNNNNYLTSSEVTIIIGSVFASGMNGVIIDGTDVDQQTNNDDAWNSANMLLNSFYYLQSNNLLSAVSANGAYVEMSPDDMSISKFGAIRTLNSIVIIGINTNCNSYDLNNCNSGTSWQCQASTVSAVNFSIPTQFPNNMNQITIKEIYNGKEQDIDFTTQFFDSSQGEYYQSVIQFQNVELDANDNTRVFIITPNN